MKDSLRYEILKRLELNPALTQRQLAQDLGISLGKANYCLQALIEKGLVKVERFRRSPHKTGYIYALTPHGLEDRGRVTYRFLKRKQQEYEKLKMKIAELQQEVDSINHNPDTDRML